MAQTTGGISFKDASLELSVNGTAWTDHGGTFVGVDISGGEIAAEDQPTSDSLYPIMTTGKASHVEATFTNVYTEVTAEAQDLIQTAYDAQSLLWARWTAKGKTTGNKLYTLASGRVLTPPYARGNVGEASAVLTEWTLSGIKITVGAVA